MKPASVEMKNKTEKGKIHIRNSFSQMLVTITDMEGNALSWSSSVGENVHRDKNAFSLAAKRTVERAARAAMEQGLKTVEVIVKGPGQGREVAIRTLREMGLEVTLIKDVTPIPHNGCRPAHRDPRPRIH